MLVIALTLVSTLCFASCDQFDPDVIAAQQAQLINDTIAKLAAMKESWDITGIVAAQRIKSFTRDNLDAMAQEMLAAGKVYTQNGDPITEGVFNDIYDNVYEQGVDDALLKWDAYVFQNKTEAPQALGKFAATSAVIRWRAELDTQRRKVHPTVCETNEQTAWANWNKQTKQTVDTLTWLIPALRDLNRSYWADLHQKMLDYIQAGLPVITSRIQALTDQKQRLQALCDLWDNLNLLNTVAGSRKPA